MLLHQADHTISRCLTVDHIIHEEDIPDTHLVVGLDMLTEDVHIILGDTNGFQTQSTT